MMPCSLASRYIPHPSTLRRMEKHEGYKDTKNRRIRKSRRLKMKRRCDRKTRSKRVKLHVEEAEEKKCDKK
jgi:hypothetical protein